MIVRRSFNFIVDVWKNEFQNNNIVVILKEICFIHIIAINCLVPRKKHSGILPAIVKFAFEAIPNRAV